MDGKDAREGNKSEDLPDKNLFNVQGEGERETPIIIHRRFFISTFL